MANKCSEKIGEYCRQAITYKRYAEYRGNKGCTKCCIDCKNICDEKCDKAEEIKNE